MELLNLLSRPPKKPFTSVLDVVFRRRSAAPFLPLSQELALFRYESIPAGVAPRSSSSEGDGWDFPAQRQSRELTRESLCFSSRQLDQHQVALSCQTIGGSYCFKGEAGNIWRLWRGNSDVWWLHFRMQPLLISGSLNSGCIYRVFK